MIHIPDDTHFGGRPLVDTRDVDEAREAIGRIFCPHFLTLGKTGRERFHARHSVVREPGYSVNLVSYGTDVDIDPGELSRFFLLQVPLQGEAVVRHGGHEVHASAGRVASLLSPTRATRMVWKGECRKLILLLQRDTMERHFETLTHRHAGAIEFDPAIMLDDTVGRSIAAHAGLMLATAQSAGSLPEAYRILLRDALSSLLLTGLPHNRTPALASSARDCGPIGVRRADEFIRASCERPISAADIAEAAGMPLRTLQDAYRKAHGMTLLDAVQAARLERLRAMLRAPDAEMSVADAVFTCGLGHLGRAAAAYRDRYGESPSQTLRRALGLSKV